METDLNFPTLRGMFQTEDEEQSNYLTNLETSSFNQPFRYASPLIQDLVKSRLTLAKT